MLLQKLVAKKVTDESVYNQLFAKIEEKQAYYKLRKAARLFLYATYFVLLRDICVLLKYFCAYCNHLRVLQRGSRAPSRRV